ncbi:transposase [Burkholderia glumae]|uniref:Transposase n=1 Tax=Burkholderia glumae TaxID=337 RepID=A0AAP9Y448_BURGL|nr:transposase [Burkholderia glumae]PNL01553.1 hypothetical protein CEQ24_021480 [Burkholderia glumae]QGA37713.1 transposase [Burkholderia glumae]QPQ93479.1 transposase [Burkholderia glumae]QQM91319.1 transposase [Burkholderia glumae]
MDALKRAEAGVAVPEICRELGVSTAKFYNWPSKYGGMEARVPDLPRTGAERAHQASQAACAAGAGAVDCAGVGSA